ncbi:MAG: hypothetical protein GY810_25410 [Aureispira sp.]|nr:hypothetical protein [Aureispira sp.]
MMPPATKTMEHRNFQNYVTIIYFFLLGIGILFDSVYFSFFEVNILRYSSVMDILLTPLDFLIELVAYATQLSIAEAVFLMLLTVIPSILTVLAISYSNKKYWANRHKKKVNSENLKKIIEGDKSREILLKAVLIGFFAGVFMPTLFAQLTSPAEEILPKMEKGTLESNHKIVFIDNSEKNVYLIRERSQYIFYVAEQDTQITISPILGTIKEIRKINILPKREETKDDSKIVPTQDKSSIDSIIN